MRLNIIHLPPSTPPSPKVEGNRESDDDDDSVDGVLVLVSIIAVVLGSEKAWVFTGVSCSLGDKLGVFVRLLPTAHLI